MLPTNDHVKPCSSQIEEYLSGTRLLINYLATRPWRHVRLLLLLRPHVGLCTLTDASCPVLITFSITFRCTSFDSSEIAARWNGSFYNSDVVENFSVSFYRTLQFREARSSCSNEVRPYLNKIVNLYFLYLPLLFPNVVTSSQNNLVWRYFDNYSLPHKTTDCEYVRVLDSLQFLQMGNDHLKMQ